MLFWSKISWFFLTFGIVLGSYWAYSELGWGGWWFWDPVENISLIPWLLNTALIHSLQVSIKNDQLKLWSLNLAYTHLLQQCLEHFSKIEFNCLCS